MGLLFTRDLHPESLMHALDRHRRPLLQLFFFCLGLTLAANAFDIFAYPFSIDAEVATFSPNPLEFFESGRWAAFVLAKFFVPYASIPVVPVLIACSTLAGSYVATACLWDRSIGWPHYVAAPFALAFPTLFQLFSFSVISYSVGTGLFLTALGLCGVAHRSLAGFGLSIALFAFAIGIYQPIPLYPSMAFLVYAALGLPQRGLRQTAGLFVLFGASMALAELLSREINRISSRILHISGSYPDTYFDFDYLSHYPMDALQQTLLFVSPILSGNGGPFIDWCIIYTVTIALACGIAVVSRGAARRGIVDYGLSVGLLAAAVVLSVLVCIVNQGMLPYRTLLGTPIAIAGVVFCAAQLPRRSTRWLLAVASTFCFLAFAQIGSRLYYGTYLAWLNDRALGEQILTRIDALPTLPEHRPLEVEFSGYHQWPASDQIPKVGGGSTMGASFFGWDEGNPDRILAFLKTLGRFDLELITPAQRRAMNPAVEAMPSWPREGSVQVVDGAVVVKFGPYSEWQRNTLGLAPPDPAPP